MRVQLPSTKRAEVNMVPLMDSMFLLLVFFIYAMMSMVVQKGIPLDLPSATTTVKENKALVTLSINPNGQYFLDKAPITLSQLHTTLTQLKRDNTDTKILIHADKNSKHEWVINALDAARKSGIRNVMFDTKEAN